MVMVIGGSTIAGASTFSSNAVFQGTVGVTGVLTQNSSVNLSSGQIAFPATQNPSSNANTLDDYEEGTFTAYFSNNAGTPLYTGSNLYANYTTGANGKYTKIGRRVFYNFYLLTLTSYNYNTGISSSTEAWISGLPFVEASGSIGGDGISVYPSVNCGYNVATSWSAAHTPMGYFQAGSSSIRLGYQGTNVFTAARAEHWYVSGAALIMSGHYETTN